MRLLVLAVVLLSGGCGGNGGGPAAATDVETKEDAAHTPAGFTVRVVKNQGFAIALPKEWRSLDAYQALSSQASKRFAKANPQLRKEIQVLARPNSPIKLLAVDPTTLTPTFLTNLNVLVTRIPSKIPFERWTAAEIAQIKRVPTVLDVRQNELRLRPGRAMHLTYRAAFNRPGGSFVAAVHQYMVKEDGFLYILTFTTLPQSEDDYRRTFEEAAYSFRLTE
jgi:hypothetical protein